MASVPAAQAATVQLNSWTWGNGNNVNASAPVYSGAAGGFSGTLTGSSVPELNGSIETYCVELTEFFSFGGSYNDYNVMAASSYFTAAKAATLGKLITYVYGNNLFGGTAVDYRDNLSSAVQLAIWNTVYDGDSTLGSGTFGDISEYRDGTVNFFGANQLLANSANLGISYDLYVLSSGRPMVDVQGKQDQLVWRRSTNQVPEPTSLALAFAALAGMGVAAKRRKA